jgi:hypothetical protein
MTITAYGNKLFLKHPMPKFNDWLIKKGYDIKDIEKMKPQDKSKIILRYKWFTDDDRSAQDCESTRKDVIFQLTVHPPNEEGDIFWFKNALWWEFEIDKIKAHFGLISQDEFKRREEEYCK